MTRISRRRYEVVRRFASAVNCGALAAACGALAAVMFATPSDGAAASGATPERIAINDNRTPGGTQSAGTLTIRLDARVGMWHPDRDADPGVAVKAFAVDGGSLQIPGPLIRVREGTEIRATVRNSLDESLAVHGLYTRPGTEQGSGPVTSPPGERREVVFIAGAPGTYYYWGATAPETTLAQRIGYDSQLVGAFIVDPRDGAPPADRVLVISNWPARGGQAVNNPIPPPGQPVQILIGRMVINGRSWPNTERLSYRVGDTVRLRLINAGSAVHPMHLHGFYFNVDSRGDERANTISARGSSPRMVVTERLPPGRTFSLTWKPTRPGNWLFHCHDNAHLARGVPLDGNAAPPPSHSHVQNHALDMMAGPVMGITVTGSSIEPASSTATKRRQLRLVARVDQNSTQAEPAYAYTLHSGATSGTPPPLSPAGPTIVLKRGEPVTITVVNEVPEATAVHWHGIELESYYDGVAGFAGEGQRIAPAIPSGGSFEARFTPPRSGTFIYHTHIDEVRQQQAGLAGALLVVDDPSAYDPTHDIVLMITIPRNNVDANSMVLLNGSAKPALREMRVGEHYRLRFINAHTFRPSMRMRLLRESTLLEWRGLAKDGMDLPADQSVVGPSEIQMGNGETYDFDFVPSAAGDMRLDVTNAGGVLLVSMPIRVR
jgi:FtsP/CotA-like multicopper oxidase with cupredoxin domain